MKSPLAYEVASGLCYLLGCLSSGHAILSRYNRCIRNRLQHTFGDAHTAMHDVTYAAIHDVTHAGTYSNA